MWGMIATWCMAKEGVSKASKQLQNNENAAEAIVTAICQVEDYPYFKSVGYGGLPNEEMEVELDAAFMDGNSLSFGAVMAIKDYANPILIARRLAEENINCVLVAEGAEKFAHKEGFERKNMLTDRAKNLYHQRVNESLNQDLKPYKGHDTVGMVCLDQNQRLTSATSTSGLFMKKKGRVGDSPIVGSGFYADALVGGATATGLGEDLMKGCISYEIVRLMKEGLSPQAACDQAVRSLDQELRQRRGSAGDCSVVAMNAKGEWGAATNTLNFSYVVATETMPATVFRILYDAGQWIHKEASIEWLDEYYSSRREKSKEEKS